MKLKFKNYYELDNFIAWINSFDPSWSDELKSYFLNYFYSNFFILQFKELRELICDKNFTLGKKPSLELIQFLEEHFEKEIIIRNNTSQIKTKNFNTNCDCECEYECGCVEIKKNKRVGDDTSDQDSKMSHEQNWLIDIVSDARERVNASPPERRSAYWEERSRQFDEARKKEREAMAAQKEPQG